MGTRHPLNAPYQAFPTSDGWITVGAANQGNWLRLVAALEARTGDAAVEMILDVDPFHLL